MSSIAGEHDEAYLMSVVSDYRRLHQDPDAGVRLAEVAYNAVRYALTLPEDERRQMADSLAADTDGCCLPHDFHLGMYCADCGAYNPEGW